ncbi:MAG: hypothetical protein KA142_05665 [Chromatiaceae bacterium]|nr:hypothetical protein [Chromatiaceae bacterium]
MTETVTQALAPAVSPQLVANIDTVAASYNLPDFVFGGGAPWPSSFSMASASP